MRGLLIAGVLLMIFGAAVLAYPAISYTTDEKVLELGPIEATAEKEKTVPLHPAIGGVALVGGGLLLAMGARKRA